MISNLKIKNTRSTASGLIDSLRALDASISDSSNKNERVIVLATACASSGVDTLPGIIDVLTRIGFGRKHVAAVVKSSTGSNPARARWTKRADGVLQLFH